MFLYIFVLNGGDTENRLGLMKLQKIEIFVLGKKTYATRKLYKIKIKFDMINLNRIAFIWVLLMEDYLKN